MLSPEFVGEGISGEPGLLPPPPAPVGYTCFDMPGNTDASYRVHVWYPASGVDSSRRKRYLTDLLPPAFVRPGDTDFSAPGVLAHASVGVPLSSEQIFYPVMLFGAELGYRPEYYSVLMEHLAAAGHLVFALSHPGLCAYRSVFPGRGGRDAVVIPFAGVRALRWQHAQWQIRRMRKSGCCSLEIYKAINRRWYKLGDEVISDARLFGQLLDFLFALHQGASLAPLGLRFLGGRLSLQDVFAVGHGWGGATAVQLCVQDSRIRAGINVNGFQWGPVGHVPVRKPLLLVRAASDHTLNDEVYFPLPDYPPPVVVGATHRSFSDLPLWHERRPAGVLSGTPIGQCLHHLLAFTRLYCRGNVQPFFESGSRPVLR